MTGFRTMSEFVAETSDLERLLIIRSIEQYYEERSPDDSGAAGGSQHLPNGGL